MLLISQNNFKDQLTKLKEKTEGLMEVKFKEMLQEELDKRQE